MILLEQPSIVFSSHDVGISFYRMTYNVTLPKGVAPLTVAAMIAAYNKSSITTFGSPLRNIVFNSHGYPGKVGTAGLLDGPGIEHKTLALFRHLRTLNLGTIWFISCDLAEDVEGKLFCQLFSIMTGTTIIASDSSEMVTFGEAINLSLGASNKIDDFEGNVYMFTPAGGSRIIDPNRDVWTVKS